VEKGTHTDLLALKGLYYRLYEMQFKSQEDMEEAHRE